MNNFLIINSIHEQRSQEKTHTNMLCEDSAKCFGKLWLKDCLIEMEELRYSSSNNINILYKMYRKSYIYIYTYIVYIYIYIYIVYIYIYIHSW